MNFQFHCCRAGQRTMKRIAPCRRETKNSVKNQQRPPVSAIFVAFCFLSSFLIKSRHINPGMELAHNPPSHPNNPERRPMEPKTSTNRLSCLNCGSTVHWTAFQCDVCGRDPREREPIVESRLPKQNPTSHLVDRRKYPRYDFQGRVILNRSFGGELIDLCQRGAKLKTRLRLFRNEVVYLDFAINGIPIQVRARVIHVKRGVMDERSTLGVCFEAIGRDHHEILNQHLKTIPQEKQRPQYLA